MVTEIDSSGCLVQLDNFTPPPLPSNHPPSSSTAAATSADSSLSEDGRLVVKTTHIIMGKGFIDRDNIGTESD